MLILGLHHPICVPSLATPLPVPNPSRDPMHTGTFRRAGSLPARPPSRTLLRLIVAVATALPMFLSATFAEAQIRMAEDWEFAMGSGFGWAAVLPDAMLGVGGFHVFGGTRWGLIGSVTIPHDSNKRTPDFQDNLTIETVENDFPEEKRILIGSDQEEWRILNLGVLRAITPEAALYVGGGAAQKSVLREFGDNTDPPLTRSGFYYVQVEDESGWEPNVSFGVLMRGGERIAFSVGFESAPQILSAGVYFVFR